MIIKQFQLVSQFSIDPEKKDNKHSFEKIRLEVMNETYIKADRTEIEI